MRVPGIIEPVAADGYRWWYVDAVANDGRHALTAIVFIGSVFSPWYAAARRRGSAEPLNHATVNLALYGPCRRWCMTERGTSSVTRSDSALEIGPSRLTLDGTRLRLQISEWTVPWPRPLRGELQLELSAIDSAPVALDQAGAHHWQAIAPSCPIRVTMRAPQLSWQGRAYVDSNTGTRPLEQSFRRWHWSRRHGHDGTTLIRYDIEEHRHQPRQRSFACANDRVSEVRAANDDEACVLAPTRWFRVPRTTRKPPDATIAALETLEDTPFYARSRYREVDRHGSHEVVHESLDLDRFSNRLVQCLLPFRAPRRS